MDILSKEIIERLQLANEDRKGAALEFVETCKLFFQPGVTIYWRHGGYLQFGVVQMFNGTANYPTIRVENSRTGKTVDVSFHDIDWDRMINQANVHANVNVIAILPKQELK